MSHIFPGLFRPKDQRKLITVVSGLPRSGTSMMMKMLEAGGFPLLVDNIREADDDNPKGYYEFERVKRLDKGDTKWLEQAQGKAVKVVAPLLPFLPLDYEYRVIFLKRDLSEILASQKKMLIHRGINPDQIDDQEMALIFEKHLRTVDLWLGDQIHINRIDVNYNQLLLNPTMEVARVTRFLAFNLNLENMTRVIDKNLYRQRNNLLLK